MTLNKMHRSTFDKHILPSEASSCWSSTLYSVPFTVYISMPIAKCVCQQSEKAQQHFMPRVSLANQMGENMAVSIRFPLRNVSVMKGRKHSAKTVEPTSLF